MKKAILDIGTNSLKFLLAELINGEFREIKESIVISRIGRNLNRYGVIDDSAFSGNLDIVLELVQDARKRGAESIMIVGTMWMRSAQNAGDFARSVYEQTGIKMQMISGEREAELAFAAVKQSLKPFPDAAIIFDIGGGSTEIIQTRAGEITAKQSIELGAGILSDRFITTDPISESEYLSLVSELRYELQPLVQPSGSAVLIGIGGTFTSLAAVSKGLELYSAEAVNAYVLSKSEVVRQIEIYKSSSLTDRKKMPGLEPDRAEIILAGAIAVWQILDLAGASEIMVSSYGIRHALIFAENIEA